METRKDEIRYITDDPKKMLGKYLSRRVIQTWDEDYTDEKTGEIVTVQKNQLLFEKGTYIDRDVLSNIMFYMQSKDITSVEVSTQKRMASEIQQTSAWPFLATVVIGGRATKFLLYAFDIPNVIEILKDYVELNYFDSFAFSQIKAYDTCVILTDNLKPISKDDSGEAEEFGKDEEESGLEPDKKFYQIESKIKYDDDTEIEQTFVVNTFDVERAMMLIELYLRNIEEKRKADFSRLGEPYVLREPHPTIESAKPIAVNCFVPREFSDVYIKAREEL